MDAHYGIIPEAGIELPIETPLGQLNAPSPLFSFLFQKWLIFCFYGDLLTFKVNASEMIRNTGVTGSMRERFMPADSKTILCLANSRKTSGRCIAGREWVNGAPGVWIRPVTARENAELSEEDRRFENGNDPRVLDIIRIPFHGPKPHAFQVENHLIDADYYWTLEGTASWEQARTALDGTGRPLWSNDSSSYNGTRDRVAEAAANPGDGSLRLIEVNDLEANVVVEGANFGNGKRKVRGRFSHGGVQHYLSITDPQFERRYLAGQNGQFPIGHALLCISLSEPYQGYIYKLIAAVIQRPKVVN